MIDINDYKKWFIKNTCRNNIHGSNILAKLNKYDELKNTQKSEIINAFKYYKDWKEQNDEITKCSKAHIIKKTKLLNNYKDSISSFEFSSQSKFHSTVNEEFLFLLFKDLINELNSKNDEEMKKIDLGNTRAYCNLYFAPKNIKEFQKSPNMRVNLKDQDFSIFREVDFTADKEKKTINIPVVSIECKTYIDKTMLEGSIATAEKIKNGNPYSLFLVFTEWYDVSYDVDPFYSRIDQIFVARKSKRKSKKIVKMNSNVIMNLFTIVEKHLKREWSNIEDNLNKTGLII